MGHRRRSLTLETIFFTEEEPKYLQNSQKNKQLVDLIFQKDKQKFRIDPDTRYHYKIQPTGYVGLIPLNRDFSLHIKPKIEVGNIFRMLEYANKLKSFNFLEGTASVGSIEDIFERLITILAARVLDRNRKGLYRGYVQRTQSLSYISGRMLIKPSTISLLKGSIDPVCEFEENTVDLKENKILLWTIYNLRHLAMEKNANQKVRMAYRELIHKVTLVPFSSNECTQCSYNKLNIDYKPMHAICRFLLEQIVPNLEKGPYEFIPFIVYMPALFELFVEEWLRQHLPKKHHLKSQYMATLDQSGSFESLRFKIDLVLSSSDTNEVCCIMDTKYTKTPQSRIEDVKQAVAYATKMKTKRAFLVYPSREIKSFNCSVGDIQVGSLVFDISGEIEASGHSFLESLEKYLSET